MKHSLSYACTVWDACLGIVSDLVGPGCYVGTLQTEARHMDRYREEPERDTLPILLPCVGRSGWQQALWLQDMVHPGSWSQARGWPQRSKTDQSQSSCLCHTRGSLPASPSPLQACSCLHWHTFCIHRGLFGWWPHTPRMLLRDEARHGARCNRKPEKGFSSLWGWEGRMLIPTRIQKGESSWHHKKKVMKNAQDIWGRGWCSDRFYLRHIHPG